MIALLYSVVLFNCPGWWNIITLSLLVYWPEHPKWPGGSFNFKFSRIMILSSEKTLMLLLIDVGSVLFWHRQLNWHLNWQAKHLLLTVLLMFPRSSVFSDMTCSQFISEASQNLNLKPGSHEICWGYSFKELIDWIERNPSVVLNGIDTRKGH